MTSWSDGRRPITVGIVAMGGEGGGVLSDWIVDTAERHGFHAQNTSVAGVAQRTGATVYYVELLPPDVTAGVSRPARSATGSTVRSEPVLSVFPAPGEVDVVVASELMEAARAVQRGFVTPDRTVLIASTNRVYSINERIVPGDGRADSDALLDVVRAGAKQLIGADFNQIASDAGSVVSASLLGAVAASGTLPFSREDFEATIWHTGKGVASSLNAFAGGFDAARQAMAPPSTLAAALTSSTSIPVAIGPRPHDPRREAARAAERERARRVVEQPSSLVGPALRSQAERVAAEFPAAAHSMLLYGCERTAVYQDTRYTDLYLDRVARLAAVDPDTAGAAALTTEAARHIALWMCYQDTIHVAQQKIRAARIERIRREVGAADGQIVDVHDYLHPQSEEVTDTMPRWVGGPLSHSKAFRRIVDRIAGGMTINTTSTTGYTMLYTMARFRPMRRRSVRFAREQKAIERWIALAVNVAATDADLARETVECQRVLKGYGQTHAHGVESFDRLLTAAQTLSGTAGAAERLAALREAALADEDGRALTEALARVGAR